MCTCREKASDFKKALIYLDNNLHNYFFLCSSSTLYTGCRRLLREPQIMPYTFFAFLGNYIAKVALPPFHKAKYFIRMRCRENMSSGI